MTTDKIAEIAQVIVVVLSKTRITGSLNNGWYRLQLWQLILVLSLIGLTPSPQLFAETLLQRNQNVDHRTLIEESSNSELDAPHSFAVWGGDSAHNKDSWLRYSSAVSALPGAGLALAHSSSLTGSSPRWIQWIIHNTPPKLKYAVLATLVGIGSGWFILSEDVKQLLPDWQVDNRAQLNSVPSAGLSGELIPTHLTSRDEWSSVMKTRTDEMLADGLIMPVEMEAVHGSEWEQLPEPKHGPKLMMPPRKAWDEETLMRGGDHDDKKDIIHHYMKLVSQYADHRVFLSSHKSHDLLMFLDTVSSQEIARTMPQAVQLIGLADPSVLSAQQWNRRELFRFMNLELHSAIELHLLLVALKGDQMSDEQLADIYAVSSSQSQVGKLRAELIQKLIHFKTGGGDREVLAAADRANAAAVKRAFLSLDQHTIRSRLQPIFNRYGLGILDYTEEQWRLIQAKHIYDFMFSDEGIEPQFRSRLYGILGIMKFQNNNEDSQMKLLSKIFKKLHYYLADNKVFFSGEMNLFRRMDLSDEAMLYKQTLDQSLINMDSAQLRQSGMQFSYQAGVYLQKDWVEEFMMTFQDSPMVEMVFLSQVMKLDGLSMMQLSEVAELSVVDIFSVKKWLTETFQQYVEAKLAWLEHQLGGFESQTVRMLDNWTDYDQSIKQAYEEKTPEELVYLIKQAGWFKQMFRQDITITPEQYQLFEDNILNTRLRQALFSKMIELGPQFSSDQALHYAYRIHKRQAQKEKTRLIVELLHIISTSKTPFVPLQNQQKLGGVTLSYYQRSLQHQIIYQYLDQADWQELITHKAKKLGIDLPINNLTVQLILQLNDEAIYSAAHFDALMMMFYYEPMGMDLKLINATRRGERLEELVTWYHGYESQFIHIIQASQDSSVMSQDQNQDDDAAVDHEELGIESDVVVDHEELGIESDVVVDHEELGLESDTVVNAFQADFENLSIKQLDELIHAWFRQNVKSSDLYQWDAKVLVNFQDFTDYYLSHALEWEVFMSMVLKFKYDKSNRIDVAKSNRIDVAKKTQVAEDHAISPSEVSKIYRDLRHKLEQFLVIQFKQMQVED